MLNSKMMLSQDALKGAIEAHGVAVQELLDPQKIKPNIVGVGVGVKWTKGQPTGKPSLIVLVTNKVYTGLSESAMIPSQVADMQTDVLRVGYPLAGVGFLPTVGGPPSVDGMRPPLMNGGVATFPGTEVRPSPVLRPQVLTQRLRPVQGGWSVGHYLITAGTVSTGVYDFLPGATVSPPAYGLGTPPKYYILSNNHVLANSNAGYPGDPILQPGPYDGGVDPADRIATLSRYIPITFEPPVPRALHQNQVDAAIAEVRFDELDRSIYWIGYVQGWRPKAEVSVGLPIKKVGRTSNLTIGAITVTNATIDVNYGGGRVARFTDQIVTTPMSAGGDSGSLVLSLEDNRAVGLLFAGSPFVTIVNQFENVRSLLQVEVSP